MYLPKWLYELLPFLYACLGLASLFGLNVSGKLSGALLLLAAYLIFKMRKSYRAEQTSGC